MKKIVDGKNYFVEFKHGKLIKKEEKNEKSS